MNLFNFFKLNSRDAVHDEFTTSKLQLSEVLFKKLQRDIRNHIEDCPNLQTPSICDMYYSFDLWGRAIDRTVKKREEYLIEIEDRKDKRFKKILKHEYKMHRKPCLDYFEKTVVPYFDKCRNEQRAEGRLNNPLNNKNLAHYIKGLNGDDLHNYIPDTYGIEKLSEVDIAICKGQRNQVITIFNSFDFLANITPYTIEIKDLTGIAMDLAKSNEISVLNNFLIDAEKEINISDSPLHSLRP